MTAGVSKQVATLLSGTLISIATGCAIHEPGDLGEPITEPQHEPEPTRSDSARADEIASDTPIEDGGRMYMLRKDGGRIPLLTERERAELRITADSVERPRRDAHAIVPPSYDLSAYQTPVRDQLDRGSCGTFATVAAIEAAYKRTHGVTLDLSEQYMFHVAKSTGVSYPRIYLYENQSSYWYGGGWPTTQYLLPTEAQAPYAGYNTCLPGASCTPLNMIPGASSLVWAADPDDNRVTQQQVDDFEYSPLHIPPAARNNARYGVASWTDYSWADAQNTALLEELIASNREVVIAVDLKWKLLPSGIYDYDSTASGGGHVVLLIGYDRAAGYFLVKNSWGGTAPSAYLKVSYNFLRNAAFDASVVNSVVPPSTAPQAKAKWMGKWHQDHEGWDGTLVVRRITPTDNSPVRLGTYYANGSYSSGHSVNGRSIDSNRGLELYVAAETENAPGTLTGQRFEADQYDWDPNHAAGSVYWTGGQGGVHLGRTPLSVPYSNTFSVGEWVGTWDLSSNGNPGVLTISSVVATSGDYTVNATLLMGGSYRTVTGTVERARPSVMHLTVDGASSYTLFYHFWDDRLASGFVTQTGVVRRGTHIVRR